MALRDFVNKNPALGWGVAALVGILAAVMFYRNISGGETAELTQIVTIRCRETAKEWTMPRGAMEKELYMRKYPVNQDEGLINPETGNPTGFPVDDWSMTVKRINAERKVLAEPASAPPTPKK